MRKPSRRLILSLAVIGACGLIGTGVMLASIPASDGVVHGCYLKSGGAIRAVTDAEILDLARDVYAVARTASVRRPSVAVIVTALRGRAKPATGVNPAF
jgi:hypothetical protein